MANANCINSLQECLESTREEIHLMEKRTWPATWKLQEHNRKGYLATMKAQERYLVSRIEKLSNR